MDEIASSEPAVAFIVHVGQILSVALRFGLHIIYLSHLNEKWMAQPILWASRGGCDPVRAAPSSEGTGVEQPG
ncbi:hypothetical protein BX600DRAFT_543886 [Xylariales sp. PMI_506]|nr:hypothetical protein BX600DRAFT_543886 [Xylariales sp. PMI_506]